MRYQTCLCESYEVKNSCLTLVGLLFHSGHSLLKLLCFVESFFHVRHSLFKMLRFVLQSVHIFCNRRVHTTMHQILSTHKICLCESHEVKNSCLTLVGLLFHSGHSLLKLMCFFHVRHSLFKVLRFVLQSIHIFCNRRK